ncbi:pimeloyl-ACP methyl ester esterase BioH [Niveibacterium umoris]|uniref:Pimeloyl-[acyl-carrier protein] methyl ester esterase n=1 Tax=Niveibacterium umoris TaxID=1193620 RepID=A0A840BG29_9RHOO|nr:alpha/beta fold hydrolase [Niveibacterium umoris]MBB4012135.1 pimeloyl-[acyl-carrier protein] methyl ester esterase [Niveibacterium umoris]
MSHEILAWHGWGFGPAAFAPLCEALPPTLRLAAPELAAPASGSFDEWVSALTATVHPHQILLGWSLGAQLALAAVAAGARPRALVLIAATPRFVASPDWPHALDHKTVESFRNGFATQPEQTLQRFLALQALGDRQRRAVTATLAAARTPSIMALAPALDALIGCDLRDRVGEVSVPTLLLHGGHDALMPRSAAIWLADRMPGARLETFADCGHAPHVSEPAAVSRALNDFIGPLADA